MTGAVVGVQPFGGEGLSGTGPKAGGPFTLKRVVNSNDAVVENNQSDSEKTIENNALNGYINTLLDGSPTEFGHLLPLDQTISKDYLGLLNTLRQDLRDTRSLPGPTGEDNLLSLNSRGLTVIATPNSEIAFQQAIQALYCGNPLLICNANFTQAQHDWLTQHPNTILSDAGISDAQLTNVTGLSNFVYTPTNDEQLKKVRDYRIALANRDGAIVRYIDEVVSPFLYTQERHLCINTTAAGGNVQLIANSE